MPRHRRWGVLAVTSALLAVLMASCGGQSEAGLEDLQLVGVDFELNSIILTNSGSAEVRTENLWIFQDGESSQFNVFIIEPRTEILFSVRDVGGVDPAGGEISLFSSDDFSDPGSVLEYVAWGESHHQGLDVAIDSGRWNEDGPVATGAGTLVLLRADPNLTGADAWTATDTLP